LAVVAGGQSVESSLASEVRCAQVVEKEESISTSSTSRILTSIWYASLALSGLDVVVAVVLAGESGVESVVTLVVAVADIVDQVESVGDSGTSGVSASSWQVGSASVAGEVEVLSRAAGECAVESVLAPGVGCAEVVSSVESVGSATASRILASIWDGVLAHTSLEVEILVVVTVVSGVESVLA